MSGFFGRKSGFKNARDLIIFLVGLAGVSLQIYNTQTQGSDLNIGALMFFGGLMGAPLLLNQDEKE